MKRPYLRVTPGEESLVPRDIPDTIASLHKLSGSESNSFLHRLNPFNNQRPLRFEFVALSPGEDEPVEFYYGAENHLDTLEQRLGSIYPPSFVIDRVEVDITKRLLRPIDYSPEAFVKRIDDGRLYCDIRETIADPPATLDDVNLAPPSALDGDDSPTYIERPTETHAGRILARPSMSEVEPHGVEWLAAAERRKDWMTTLTHFEEVVGQQRAMDDDRSPRYRHTLVSLIEALVEVSQPIAFQVVFQRKLDWSRDARRRTGELLEGSDTLLQKVLGFESPGARRPLASSVRSTRSTRQDSSRTHTSRVPGGKTPRIPGVEQSSRFDEIRANDPKRTFTANVRLLALPIEEEADDLRSVLDPLRSVFDLIDGEFYEVNGRRLRSHGHLPGAGKRHARDALEHFTDRSIMTGGRSFSISNRSETRPDLVLNGDELANFVIIPSATELPSQQHDSIGRSSVADTEAPSPEPEIDVADAPDDERVDGSFPSIPDTLLHRDDEVDRLIDVLEPFVRVEQADTILITGPTGSGKTSIATFAVDHFRKDESDINGVYVNCWEDRSRFQVLYRILDRLESTLDIHRQSTPRDVLLERLREYGGPPCVVILDEVDQVEDKELLYNLFNLTQFSLLLIANQEADLLEGIDERLTSRLQACERIHCQRYTDDQLVDILQAWSDRELDAIAVDKSALTELASAARGDARVAITTVRIAARRAGQSRTNRINPDVVEDALPEARREVQETQIEDLTPHQQVVFRVVAEEGEITPADLYEAYQDRVEEPKSDRTVRNYIHKLERYDLVVTEGSTRDRVYRCTAPSARW